MTVELAPHQIKAVKKMRNGSVLCGGVGTGKTRTALAYYVEQEYPEDLIVITTAKKRDTLDWESEAAKFGIGTAKDATLAGVMKVDSWNNIGKYEHVKNAFFIFDEQRLVGAGAWVKSFLKIAKNNSWIMLSATPGDSWMDYIPVFIANGFYKNRTEFKLEHVVYDPNAKFPRVLRYLGVSRLAAHRDQILVDMPYERHTTRHIQDLVVDFDRDLFDKVLKRKWHVYEDRPLRDVTELYMTMRKVVNSDPSRVRAVKSLLEKHDRLIVFYNFNYELEMLRMLASEISDSGSRISFRRAPSPKKSSDTFSVGEWNGQKHQAIPESDRWLYLVQYMAGSEGWNCTRTDAICFYSLTYSYRMYEQAQGRIDRLNTPFSDLWYYVLRSESLIDHAIWRALLAKKSFNEAKTGLYHLDKVANG